MNNSTLRSARLRAATGPLGALLLATIGCMSGGIDSGVVQPRYSSAPVEVWNRPNEVNLELDKDLKKQSAKLTYIFGISTSDVEINDYSKVVNRRELDPVVEMAAAKAAEAADADGFYVTNEARRRSGLWPIYFEDEYEVQGRPVRLKSLGLMGAGRFDARRRYAVLNPGAAGGWEGLDPVAGGGAGGFYDGGERRQKGPGGFQVGYGSIMGEDGWNRWNWGVFSQTLEFGYHFKNNVFAALNLGFNGTGNDFRFDRSNHGLAFAEIGYAISGHILVAGGLGTVVHGLGFSGDELNFTDGLINTVRLGYIFDGGFNISGRVMAAEVPGTKNGIAMGYGLVVGYTL